MGRWSDDGSKYIDYNIEGNVSLTGFLCEINSF
jgi:hypothetical protein